MEIINVNPKKCIGCNACTRVCPVPEACITKFTPEGRVYTDINPDKCINCGECIKACTHDARDFEDDYEDFIEDMYSKKGQVSLLVDPSIKTAFKDVWQDVLKWFYTQGIRKIYDVSFGADICTWAQIRSMNRTGGKYITTQCASVISYAQKHNTALLEKLSPVHSPAACMAIYAKKYLKDTADFAYFGPCIARKEEFADTGIIKYNVTFKRMKQYFEKRKTTFSNTGQGFVFEFSGKQGFLGSIYPKPGGVKNSINEIRPDLFVTTVSGTKHSYQLLNTTATAVESYLPDVLEVHSCEEGCNASVGIGNDVSIYDINKVMDLTQRDAEKRNNGLFNSNKTDKLFKDFDKELKLEYFWREYKPKTKYMPIPNDNDLNNIYNSMFKMSFEDRHIDCQACGNKSCSEMAVSIFHGTNIKENCIYYARKLPKNDSAQVADIRRSLGDTARMIKENLPALSENVQVIQKEAVSIFTNNTKTAEAAKTINSVIEQMIEACNNPKGVSQETLAEICGTLDLIRKILLNLGKFVTKNSESGYNINKSITSIDNVAVNISETIDLIMQNQIK